MIDLIDYTPEAARADWLAQRPTFIGASEIAALCGEHPYMTALDVYLAKVQGVTVDDNEHMAAGRRIEPVILDMVAERHGVAVIPNAALVRHPDVPFVACTPDGYFGDDGLVEAKNTSRMIDEPAQAHIYQIAYQLGVTGRSKGILAYLCQGWKLVTFEVDANPDLFADLMAVASDFWRNHVEPQIPPAPHSAADVVKLHPRHTDGKAIEAAPEVAEMIETLRALDADAKALDARREELKGWIQAAMGDAEALTIGGNAAVTWKISKDSAALDAKRLAAEHPEIVAAYQITKPGSRRFLLK